MNYLLTLAEHGHNWSPELVAIVTIGIAIVGAIIRMSWWGSSLSSDVKSINTNMLRLVKDFEDEKKEHLKCKESIAGHTVEISNHSLEINNLKRMAAE